MTNGAYPPIGLTDGCERDGHAYLHIKVRFIVVLVMFDCPDHITERSKMRRRDYIVGEKPSRCTPLRRNVLLFRMRIHGSGVGPTLGSVTGSLFPTVVSIFGWFFVKRSHSFGT